MRSDIAKKESGLAQAELGAIHGISAKAFPEPPANRPVFIYKNQSHGKTPCD